MAAAQDLPLEHGDRRNKSSQYHHDRNRTFSSTTTNHYKNKLAQIGIEKDLREILERKRLQKEYEQDFGSSENYHNEYPQTSPRRVRFEEERPTVQRSKSFTSGSSKNSENYPQRQRPQYNRFIDENNLDLSQNSTKTSRKQKFHYVDLHNPTNIKIELKTESGDRKCVLDSNVSISGVKCDLKYSQSILKNSEVKQKIADPQKVSRDRKNENLPGRQKQLSKINGDNLDASGHSGELKNDNSTSADNIIDKDDWNTERKTNKTRGSNQLLEGHRKPLKQNSGDLGRDNLRSSQQNYGVENDVLSSTVEEGNWETPAPQTQKKNEKTRGSSHSRGGYYRPFNKRYGARLGPNQHQEEMVKDGSQGDWNLSGIESTDQKIFDSQAMQTERRNWKPRGSGYTQGVYRRPFNRKYGENSRTGQQNDRVEDDDFMSTKTTSEEYALESSDLERPKSKNTDPLLLQTQGKNVKSRGSGYSKKGYRKPANKTYRDNSEAGQFNKDVQKDDSTTAENSTQEVLLNLSVIEAAEPDSNKSNKDGETEEISTENSFSYCGSPLPYRTQSCPISVLEAVKKNIDVRVGPNS